MQFVSFAKGAKNVTHVLVSRNGFPRQHQGTIRKSTDGYTLVLKEGGRTSWETLRDAKAHAKSHYESA